MDNDERKQASSRDPYTQLEQIHSDFVLAMALQEQERAFTILTAIESDSNEEESDDDSSSEFNADDNDYEFFQSHEFESEMEFLQQEGQDSSSDEDMEEDGDEVDSDELSYEDLIALGEFVGQERRGLSINEISTCLRPCKYESSARKTGTDRCVICQMEYEEDESLVALSCDHPYHSECIAKWLQINRICPICSTEVSSPKNVSANV
ncbi:zinc finger family protein [Salix suchowensis]|nr:zinc finger family protein [Salix suchowensis]